MAESKHSKNIPGPWDLTKEAWGIFVSKFWLFASIFGLGLVLTFLGVIVALIVGFSVFFLFGQNINYISGTILGVLGFIFISAVVYISVLFQIGYMLIPFDKTKDKGIREILSHSRKLFWPILLTTLLSTLIIWGGFMFFVIPGIMLAVWFTLMDFVVINENKKNLLALHTSREYIRGRFWPVVWRLIAVYLPFIILGGLTGFANDEAGMFFNSILQLISFFAGPFYVCYAFVLYQHLSKTSDSPKVVPAKDKKVYFGLSVAGFVLLIASIIIFSV